jgi:aryl-alcohol dehydrogenase-like predicted oxidoreductase
MRYRLLGKTGMNVSVIGLGTWQYGGEWGHDFTQGEVDAIVAAAQDCGINLVDTAECYGDHLSERLLGNALRGRRDKWLVATKFGHDFRGFMNRDDKRSAQDARRQLEESLRALQTDYIDLYQYHSIRDSEFDDEALRAFLEKQVKAGKVRHLGNSIASGLDPQHQAQRSQWAGVEALQLVYNRLERKAEQVFELCRQQQLGVLARVPLASGLLSGKYRPGTTFTGSDVRAQRNPEQLEAQLREVERIQRKEVPPGVDMAKWALAWCLHDQVVTSVIPGAKSVEQVRANAAAAELVDAA